MRCRLSTGAQEQQVGSLFLGLDSSQLPVPLDRQADEESTRQESDSACGHMEHAACFALCEEGKQGARLLG